MSKAVGVSFGDRGKTYYFSTNKLELKKGMNVIVETEKGQQFGQVVLPSFDIAPKDLGMPLKDVLRIANEKDETQNLKNKEDSSKALLKARNVVLSLNMNMRIIEASYNFDRSQLLFYFLSDSRVDFRELAKKLAQLYKTRIELRQIGVRDKAKEVGGLGPCGRFLCCSSFLTDFNSVSINMAKNQMLALNPSKINGVCGRLLCCLNYEDETYTELKKGLPNVGQHFDNGDVNGRVVGVNILKRTVNVETKNRTQIEVVL